MDHFNYRHDQLFAENVSVADIAKQFGTPCFIYSRATLERHWYAYDTPSADIDHLICYSVKANGNLAILQCLSRLGSGFDIVSEGELERVLKASGDPKRVVYSGVYKSPSAIARALEVGIYAFNVESEDELQSINDIAAAKKTSRANCFTHQSRCGSEKPSLYCNRIERK